MRVLHDAGYGNLAPEGEHSYAFDGMVGSLDHVLASPAAAGLVTGSDIWEINAHESVGLEYSRHNYNVVDLYAPDPYRASDHNPEVVGLRLGASGPTPGPPPGPPQEPTDPPTEGPTPQPDEPTDEPGAGPWQQFTSWVRDVLERLLGGLRWW